MRRLGHLSTSLLFPVKSLPAVIATAPSPPISIPKLIPYMPTHLLIKKVKMVVSSGYIYQEIPRGSIRLVNLLPGHPGTELHCEITNGHFLDPNLDSGPPVPYEALSYTWGDPVFPCRINCADTQIPVTQNLSDALCQLRKRDENRFLWIDAVCINQQDAEEKKHQLPLMKYIYGRASCVIIWLGLADEFTVGALLLIDRAAKLLRKETGQHIPQPRQLVREVPSDEKNKERGLPLASELEKWRPLKELLARPWFSRAWVQQESAMASSAIAMVGGYKRDWADFGVAATFFAYKGYGQPVYGQRGSGFADHLGAASALWSSSLMANGLRNPERSPLLALLWLADRTKATDPRDKVYSLLGLALEEEALKKDGFEADYTKKEREAFSRLARHLLCYPHPAVKHELALLATAKHYEDDKSDNWPSWVPKWHKETPERAQILKERRGTMYIISNLPSSQKFWAGGRESRIDLLDKLDPYVIAVEGFVFATISTNVRFLKDPPLSRPRLWNLVLDIRKVREDRHALYPTREMIDEAFAQTLTLSGTVPDPTGTRPLQTYHAIDFTYFCFSLFKKTLENMDTDGYNAMMREFGLEHNRLKNVVEGHEPSETFSRDMQTSCLGRKLFGTKEGYIGVGDITLQADDLVCVLFGGKVPFVLRKMRGHYRLVGECYLHGIMFGEALDWGQKMRQWFHLR